MPNCLLIQNFYWSYWSIVGKPDNIQNLGVILDKEELWKYKSISYILEIFVIKILRPSCLFHLFIVVLSTDRGVAEVDTSHVFKLFISSKTLSKNLIFFTQKITLPVTDSISKIAFYTYMLFNLDVTDLLFTNW